jgi:hypothetical protein
LRANTPKVCPTHIIFEKTPIINQQQFFQQSQSHSAIITKIAFISRLPKNKGGMVRVLGFLLRKSLLQE